jgi:hypothetical protein
VYLHPWELDPEQPRIHGKLKSRLRHYSNLHKMQDRLEFLLRNYSFLPFRDVIAASKEAGDSIEPAMECSALLGKEENHR